MDNRQIAPDEQQKATLACFLELEPTEFIDQAYRLILRREPDPAGRNHYIAALCTGMLGRVEILNALSRSPEGRSEGVVIDGLQGRARLYRLLFGLPLLGRLLRFSRRIRQAPMLSQMVVELALQQQAVQQHLTALTDQQQDLQQYLGALTEQQQAVQQHLGVLSEQQQAVQQHLAGIAEHQQDVQQHLGALSEQQQQFAGQQYQAEVRLGILDAGVNSIRLETRRAVAEYRRYLLALEPPPPAAVNLPSLPQATACAFGNSIYAGFEDEFRGSPEQVRAGLAPYLPLVREVALRHPALPVIDLGCGRGEWLELLAEQRILARGADLNPVVVTLLVERGYDVSLSDVFSFLGSQADASAAVVTSFHLIEHLPPEQWIPLLDEMLRVLAPGGLAIIETPNPRNILVGAGDFYRDPSHRMPVFPDTLAYFGRVRGFDDSAACFFAEGRTRLIAAAEWRFDTIEDYVRVSRDYAWVARKAI